MTERIDLDTGDETNSRNALLQQLGLAGEASYLPEDQAPAVDLRKLHALVDHELPDDESLAVCRLMASFRSWNDSYVQVLREHTDKGGVEQLGDPSGEDHAETRKICDEDLIEYAAGDLDALDDEIRGLIARERERVGSPVWKWFQDLERKARNPFNVDWKRLL